ncbi:MAG TPA: DoxX family protein [Gemmatimonadaceae bacterium]|nr:DoxX family protein [Gemmatimonadaceae bacterium]
MTRNLHECAPLPLRILLGIGCVHHGWHNVVMADERIAFTWMLGQIGITHAMSMLWIISVVSFIGGIALITGTRVRSVSVALAINVAGILFLIHVPSGFDYVKLTAVTAQGPQFGMPGYEVSLLYMAGLLSLNLSGAGAYSVDAIRTRRRLIANRRVNADRVMTLPLHEPLAGEPYPGAKTLVARDTRKAYACATGAQRETADASGVSHQSIVRAES